MFDCCKCLHRIWTRYWTLDTVAWKLGFFSHSFTWNQNVGYALYIVSCWLSSTYWTGFSLWTTIFLTDDYVLAVWWNIFKLTNKLGYENKIHFFLYTCLSSFQIHFFSCYSVYVITCLSFSLVSVYMSVINFCYNVCTSIFLTWQTCSKVVRVLQNGSCV